MSKCCIRRCNSNSRENVEGLSFFRFPSNKALEKLWKDNIRTENIKPFKVVRVCSKHFEENCINRTLDVVRLKDDAVPTIFPFTSSARCSSSSGKPRVALERNISENKTALLQMLADKDTKKIEKLSERVQLQQKKIKVLRQKCRRLKQKVHDFQGIIDKLKQQNFDSDKSAILIVL